MIRNAAKDDLSRILAIFASARGFMHSHGNPTQWTDGYPDERAVLSDIALGAAHVLYDSEGIYGAFSLFTQPDPCYARIYGGAWPNDAPYVTIHRIASDGTHRGVVQEAVSYALSVCPHVRVDTHKNNLPMQNALQRAGFRYCGVIMLNKPNDPERMAYQKDGGC